MLAPRFVVSFVSQSNIIFATQSPDVRVDARPGRLRLPSPRCHNGAMRHDTRPPETVTAGEIASWVYCPEA
jgi:hypothetical protein